MGFYSKVGGGLFAGIISAIVGIVTLWNFQSLSEVQKYFGTVLLMMIIMFFILTTYFDYLNEETKKEVKEEIEKLRENIEKPKK